MPPSQSVSQDMLREFARIAGEYGGYLYALLALLALLILFYAAAYVVRRARRHSATAGVAISFDDLDRMARTGLLSPEEQERVRRAISRRWVERQTAPQTTLESLPALAAAAESGAATATAAVREGGNGGGDGGAGVTKSDAGAGADRPEVSLAELARTGQISAAEFAELRAILGRKKRGKA